ncbi:MAG TPA: 50S ribosomal protein L5 [Phycisphaerales bacterium]|nr:50S ribosomal protein L5 [Phycisphaerales bacterium]
MAKKKKADTSEPTGPLPEPRLEKLFKESIRKQIGEKFGITNPMAQPKLEKIVLNVNIGRHLDGTKVPANIKQTVADTLTTISGQKPIFIQAKKSVSNFKVREGYDSALMVTLRRDRMWYFLERFIHLATPRIKDFRGLSPKAFDRQGNYSTGLTEQGVFPEINMAEVNFTHGMNINFVFSNSNAELSRFVLDELGMPFQKSEAKK